MPIDFIYPDYEVVRNYDRCVGCRVCERQCANEAHYFDEAAGKMMADESKCVNCHRCVSLCPTRALKIVKTDHTFKRKTITGPGRLSRRSTARRGAAACCFPLWETQRISRCNWDKSSLTPLRSPTPPLILCGSLWKPGFIWGKSQAVWNGTRKGTSYLIYSPS